MHPILLLHEDQDLSALWLADRFRVHGRRVTCVSGSDLAAAHTWAHRLGRAAPASTIILADGRVIGSDHPGGIINRLIFLPHALYRRLGGDDADYARQEFYALLLSWLTALTGTMINRPTPQGLSGAWRHPSHWSALAVAAGLPIRPWQQDDADDAQQRWEPETRGAESWVFALPDRLVDLAGLPPHQQAAAQTLCAQAGGAMLGLGFEQDDRGSWQFVRATVMPDLVGGGDALVRALLEALDA